MPVIIASGVNAVDGIPIDHPRLLYDDIFGLSTTTLVASTEATGFEKENAADHLTYDFWKATTLPATLEAQAIAAQEIDYLLIAAHNGGDTLASFQPQYHNGSTWVDLAPVTDCEDNSVMLFLFAPVTASRVRVSVTDSASPDLPPSLGVVMAGKALGMERSVPLDHMDTMFARKTVFNTNASEGGQFLGRSVRRQGIEEPVRFNHLTASWVRTQFQPFIDHVRESGFFGWAWSPATHPDDVAYCTCEDDIRPKEDGLPDTRSVEFTVKGLLE